MASASIPAQPGERIAGKYQIERVIGTGGVGMVVAARHLILGQTVALKFLLPGAAHDKNDVRRFEREAQSAVQLKNEHVCRVYDVGELEDGSPFIVLEYLEGQDLAHVLRSSGPLPIVEAVGHLLQVCEAVAEAHSLGMVHRDLKPSNFFLTYRHDGLPLVKVLDFGIAKYKIELEQQDVSLTQTRALLGSPVYMSPEQVRSARSVDSRSDIWSLGVCLFELLTDTVPFGGETVTGVAAAVATDPVPPIARHRPDVPEGLAHVIERCLAKHPEDRYQSVADLAEALAPFGPSEAAYSLYRISGALGIKRRTGPRELRDSDSNPAQAAHAVEHLTQISSSDPVPVAQPLHTKRAPLALLGGALVLLGVAGLFVLSNRPTQSPAVASATVPASSMTLPAQAAKWTETETVRAISAPITVEKVAPAVSPVSAPSILAPARPPTPSLAARPSVAPTNNSRADTATKKKTTKKSFVGGSIDDIVDTRH
jgi:eukaryotic-like serine/threonine-protein kinase